MKKFIMICIVGVALSGCVVEDGDTITNENSDLTTVCIGGVEYWFKDLNTRAQTMAPKIDSETLNFVRCD